GRKFATTNYGMLYTAKGTASLLVPLANVLTSATGSWHAVFYVAAILNIIAAVMALAGFRPMRRPAMGMGLTGRETPAGPGADGPSNAVVGAASDVMAVETSFDVRQHPSHILRRDHRNDCCREHQTQHAEQAHDLERGRKEWRIDKACGKIGHRFLLGIAPI